MNSEKAVDVVKVVAARPKTGFVTQIGAREGNLCHPHGQPVSLADTSKVWIDIALYPDQLAWIRNGDEVTVKAAPMARNSKPRGS